MKRIFFLLLISLSFFSLNAKSELMDSVIYQGREKYGFDHIFTRANDLMFRLADDSIQGEWSIHILNSKDEWISQNSVYNKKEKVLVVWTQYLNWSVAKRIYDPTLNRDLYQIKVSFTTYDGREEGNILKFALLPEYPVVSNLDFEWVYDWKNDYCDPGILSFNVKSDGAQYFNILESQSHLFDKEDLFYQASAVRHCPNEVWISLDYCDWGEFVTVTAINDFGYSSLQVPISTTELIDDVKVLNRIDELRNKASISKIEDVDSAYNWNNHSIHFSSFKENIDVYDIQGRHIKTKNNTDEIELDDVISGFYIVKVKDNDNKVLKFKILKK